MAEAELRREADKLFREMGMDDIQRDALDFFQRNPENGSSSDWKKSLKAPSSRSRRTNSSGTTLIHLKKKYSTGQLEAAAARSKAKNSIDNSDLNGQQEPPKGKVSPGPAAGVESRFGFAGTAKQRTVVNSSGGSGSGGGGGQPQTSPERDSSSLSQKMIKRRPLQYNSTEAPEKNKASSGRKITHSSSAGHVVKYNGVGGNVIQGKGNSNIQLSSGSLAKQPQPNPPTEVNGSHTPTTSGGADDAAHGRHKRSNSHNSSVTTIANTSDSVNSSEISNNNRGGVERGAAAGGGGGGGGSYGGVHNSIDRSKLAGLKMRSFTKSSIAKENNNHLQRKLSAGGDDKSSQAVSGGGGDGGKEENTQVVYSRKSSFKVINVSSSSHRILHTVQDGGAPKRHNSVERGRRPVSTIDAPPSSSLRKPTPIRAASEKVIGHIPKLESHQGRHISAQEGGPSKYDSFVSSSAGENEMKALVSSSSGAKKKGVYDRLSPPVSTGKEEPVYETISDTQKNVHDLQSTKSADSVPPPPPRPPVNTNQTGTTRQIFKGGGVNNYQEKDPGKSGVPVQSSNRGIHTSLNQREKLAHTEVEAKKQKKQKDSSNGRFVKSHFRRYSADSGAIYTIVNKKKTPSQSRELTDEVRHPSQVHSIDSTQPYSRTKAFSKPEMRSHRELSSSLSDGSTTSRPSKTPEISSDSDADHTLHSSISPTVSFSEQVSDRDPTHVATDTDSLGSNERQAKLDFNWSRQSLNLNSDMKEVASSTVAALSTLIEALATPSKLDNEEFRFECEEESGTSKKWYQQDSDEAMDSSLPISPISSLTSSTSVTSPQPTTTPVYNQRTSHDTNFTGQNGSNGGVMRCTSQTSSTGSSSSTNQNVVSEVDGMAQSRVISDSGGGDGVSGEASKNRSKKKRTKSENSAAFSGSFGYSKASFPNKEDPVPTTTDTGRKKSIENTTNKTGLTSLGSNTSGVSLSSRGTSKSNPPPDPLNHDYAILEPPPTDHDYAILDPEYHEEFYGYCTRCGQPVIGMRNGCVALERIYHLKCFMCSKCGVSLSNQNFFTHDKQLLCEKDNQVMLEQCHACKKKIQSRVLRALGHSYHPKCFSCSVCGIVLDGIPYTSNTRDRIFCVQDYHRLYGPRCDACDQPIIPQKGQRKSLRVIAMEKNYHIHCYKCEDCKKQLANRKGGGEKCYPLNGHLLCRSCHSNRLQGVVL